MAYIARAPGLTQGTGGLEMPHQYAPELVEHGNTAPPPGIAADPTQRDAADRAAAGIPDAMAGLQGQITDLQKKMTSSYPTYQNSLGLGSQNPFGAPGLADTSRGFNPWSLMGEANSR